MTNLALVLLAVGVAVTGGLAALLAGRSSRVATLLGASGAVLGGAVGLVPAIRVLLGAPTESFRAAWSVPGGSFFVEIDPLSAFFLVPIFALTAAAALHGAGAMREAGRTRALGPSWLAYALLTAGMVLVVVARNGVLFLVSWEVMSIAAFFLVTFDDEREDVRRAGWTYLVATHVGTAFLFGMFVLLGKTAGSLDFDLIAARGVGPAAGTVFVLALVGFGAKAGFVPFHVWLPEAHPAAPSHVSAVMSGVMVKTGLYGIARVLLLAGPPRAAWGWALVTVGLVSALLGILLALTQRDLKRFLAYSTVENVGIVAVGLGLGVLGLVHGSIAIAALGFAGALLHVANHAAFKGLLFLAAGSAVHAAGTRDMESLGGLSRRMPLTGAAFLIGAVAICGLPPLNGFVGEFLLYAAGLRAGTSMDFGAAVPAIVAVAGLAFVGALSLAAFTRAFGIAFLGEPRGAEAARAHPEGAGERAAMVVLAAACVVGGLGGASVVGSLGGVVGELTGSPEAAPREIASIAGTQGRVAIVGGIVLATAGALALVRRRLLARRRVTAASTWDCGYAAPTARMQYTATSFARPLLQVFGPPFRQRAVVEPVRGLFPSRASISERPIEHFAGALYRPLFGAVVRAAGSLKWLQHGRLQLYVLYIAVTLLVLLLWKVR